MVSLGNYKTGLSFPLNFFIFLLAGVTLFAETSSSREKIAGYGEGESKGWESMAAVVDMPKCI